MHRPSVGRPVPSVLVSGPVSVPGRAHRVDIDGVRVHAVEWQPHTGATSGARGGDRPDGRRILLVHGLGASTLSWVPVAQGLADQLGATVTALDLAGHGRTRATTRPATIESNRNLIVSFLEAHGPATVFGNSMGGVLGAGVTARRPDLVDALVLVNPALQWRGVKSRDWRRIGRFVPVMVPSFGHRVIATRARALGPERLVDLSLAMSLHDPSRLDPTLRRRLVHLAAERFAYPEAPQAYADAARTLLRELNDGADTDLGVAARARPTLLLHGALDRLVAVDLARAAAERHEHLELRILDGIGHAPQLEDPATFLEVTTAWLDRIPAPHPA